MMNRRHLTGGLLGGAGMLMIGASAPASAQLPPTQQEVFFDPDAPVMGNPEGDVTIVEYFDYQCGYCKRGHGDLLEVVKADGRIRLVLKDWPIFGEVSLYASQVVLGAHKLGLYERANTALMALPGRLTQGDIFGALMAVDINPAATLKSYAAQAKTYDALLLRNDDQARAFGLSGTPGFLVGTALNPGALQKDELIRLIAEARKRQAVS